MSDEQPASRDEFLARALHDLKAPARHVVNFSGMLRDSLDDHALSDASLRYLDTIERSGASMQQILQSLGDYLRMPPSAGPISKIDVTQLLEYCWSDVAGPDDNEQSRMTVQGAAAIESDARLLSLALTQALHNALRFRKPQEVLTVECEVSQGGERCSIQIRDNGIGIDPAFVNRAVEPFARLPTPGVKCGAGLGLSLCRRAIDLLAGDLQLASDGRNGTTVTFQLPRVLQPSGRDHAAENDPQSP